MSVDISTLGIEVKSDGVATASDRLDKLTTSGKNADDTSSKLTTTLDKLGYSSQALAKYVQDAAMAFAAWELAKLASDAALLAARYETLGVVMKVVGNNAGYTGDQMAAFQVGLQKTGISAIEARQGLALMGQAQVDMAKSSQLARVAQDAAVIANTNSSEAFNRMMTGISTGAGVIMHHMGLMVNFVKGEQDLAASLGKTKETLTQQELTQARVNEVMRVSVGIAGSYEAAMGTVGKAINSLKRFIDDAKVGFGELFTPALGFAVDELTVSLKSVGGWFKDNKGEIQAWGAGFRDTLVTIAAEVTRLSMLLDKAGGSMTSAGMLLFGPGAALGNANSKAQFEKLAAMNMEFEKRYQGGEVRLQSLAGKMSDVAPSGNTSTDAAQAAHIAAGVKLRAEAAAAAKKEADEKAAEEARQQAERQAQYDKQVLDSEAAIRAAYAVNRKAIDDAALKERLAQLTYEKDTGLKTIQEFIDAKYTAERAAWSKELDDANTQSSAMYQKYSDIWDKSGSDALQTNQAWKDYIKTLNAAQLIAEKINSADATKPRDSAINQVDQLKQVLAAEQALASARGDSYTAAQLQIAQDNLGLKYKNSSTEATLRQVAALNLEKIAYDKELAIKQQLQQAAATNSAFKATQVGINEYGGFDTVSDQTKNLQAVQADAHTTRMQQIADEVTALQHKADTENMTATEAIANIDLQLAAYQRMTDEQTSDSQKMAKITLDGYHAQLAEAGKYTSMAGTLFTALAGTQDQSSRAGFESAKAYNEGAVIMNTATAVMAQLSIPGPVGWAGAALAGLTGAINLKKVEDTSFGGGAGNVTAPGSFSGGGANGGAAPSGIGSDRSAAFTSVQDNQSLAAMQKLTDSVDNSSVAMRKVSDGLTTFANILSSASAQLALGAAPGVDTQIGSAKSVLGSMITDFTSTTKSIIAGAFGQNGILGVIEAPLLAATSFFTLGASAIGSMFGIGNSWQVSGAGVSLGINNGQLAGNDYTTEHKSGGWFSSDSNKTDYSALDGAFSAWLNTYVKGYASQVNLGATILGTTDNIAGVNVPQANIATAGRSQADIQKDLEAWLQTVGDAFAKTVVGLSDYAAAGEDAYATLMRLTTSLQTVNGQFELIGHTLNDSTLQGADLASNLVDLMGGADAFTKTMGTYFTSMFTQAQQDAATAAQDQQQVSAAFATMGVAVPATDSAFSSLVNSLDTTTESGASLFAALMQIAPTFADMTKKADALVKTNLDLDVQLAALGVNGKQGADYLALLNQQREIEYQAMDASTAAIQREINAINDSAAAMSAAASTVSGVLGQLLTSYQDNAAAADAALATSSATLDRSYAAARADIVNEQTAQLNVMNATLASLTTTASNLKSGLDMVTTAQAAMHLATTNNTGLIAFDNAMTALSGVIAQAQNGDFSQIATIQPDLTTLTNLNPSTFASDEDYKRAFYAASNAMAELQTLTAAKETDTQKLVDIQTLAIQAQTTQNQATLNAFDAELNAIKGVATNVMPIDEARADYIAKVNLDNIAQAQLKLATTGIANLNTALTTGNATDAAAWEAFLTQLGNITTTWNGIDIGAGQLATTVLSVDTWKTALISLAGLLNGVDSSGAPLLSTASGATLITSTFNAIKDALSTTIDPTLATNTVVTLFAAISKGIGGTIDPTLALATVTTLYSTIAGALSGKIDPTLAISTVDALYGTIATGIGGTISATAAINTVEALFNNIQASISGTIDPTSAVTTVFALYTAIQNGIGGVIDPTLATKAISTLYATIADSQAGTISPALAQSVIATLYSDIQKSIGGTISPDLALKTVDTLYQTVTDGIGGNIDPTLAITTVNTLYSTLDASIGGKIDPALAISTVNTLYSNIAANLGGSISTDMAVGVVSTLYVNIATAMSGKIDPKLAINTVTDLYTTISQSIAGNISPDAAIKTVLALYNNIETGLVGTIDPVAALKTVSDLYLKIQNNLGSTIDPTAAILTVQNAFDQISSYIGSISTTVPKQTIADAFTQIQGALSSFSVGDSEALIVGQFGIVKSGLGDGIQSLTDTMTSKMVAFNDAIAAYGIALAATVTAATAPQRDATFAAAKNAYTSARTDTTTGLVNGTIGLSDYNAQTATESATINAASSADMAAGGTGLSSADQAVYQAQTSAATDAYMKRRAGGILAELSQWVLGGIPLTDSLPQLNISGQDTSLYGGILVATQANLSKWESIQDGSLKWSSLGLPAFAAGTPYVPNDMTANIHQGEIIMDRASSDVLRKYGVPQHGAADNRTDELIAEIKALREENKALRADQKIQAAEQTKWTQKMSKIIVKWDGIGMPAVAA